ncbi:hypothetical protein KI811_17790 [Geobacter hydrogenophilus]|uniref:hypothetical protein n=1 Tax=Geobacter hydrogenophilus TaxID=40983 RepID=UPI001BD91942|nr:hypothetical protein [Geobacter hydrogenophilus]MBT0895661.1 hypothetical protein [Geobacter hydrogenophilus]
MNSSIIYRGMDTVIIGKQEIVNDYLLSPRLPRNMPFNLHNDADIWFGEKFKFKFRSQAIFCTGSIAVARTFGAPAAICPIGEHLFCWSPDIGDLYISYQTSSLSMQQLLEASFYTTFTYSDTEIMKKALASGNEMMLWCNSYLATELNRICLT